MNARLLRALALIAGLLAIALAGISFWLIAVTPGLNIFAGWGFTGYDGVFALVYAALGLLITTRRPHNVIGWLFVISALLSGIQTVTASYAHHALTLGRPGGSEAAWITGWIWIPAVGVITLTLLLFPDGRLPSPVWRWAVYGLIPVTTLVTLLWAVATPDSAATLDPFAIDPLGLSPDHPLRVIAGPSLLLLTLWLLVGAASLVARMRHAGSVERQQIKWVLYAAALVGPAIAGSAVTTLVPTDFALTKATQLLGVGSVLLVPVAAGVAILRYRLYDIDVLINRTLVYGAVSAILGAAYVLGVIVFQSLLRPFTGGSELAIAVSTLIVAALFQPVRARVQNAVDRRFYRARYDAARTLDEFSDRLRGDLDLDSVQTDLVDVLHDTLRPVHASVWLRQTER